METEHVVFNYGQLDDLTYIPLEEKDLSIAEQFVECTRHLVEIHQLFSIFQYNVKLLTSIYSLAASGELTKDGCLATSPDDFIAVNALLISIISAGSTLVNSQECYIKANCSEQILQKYKKETGIIYDTVFEYRFLSKLRDFAQHGHVPVGVQQDHYCFDMYQIYRTPHFDFKSAFKKEITDSAQEIMENYKDTPTLSFTLTLVRYVEQISIIQSLFFSCIEDHFSDIDEAFLNMTNQYADNLIKDVPTGVFIYEDGSGELQAAVDFKESMVMFEDFKTEASEAHTHYKEIAEYLFEGVHIIPLENNQKTSQVQDEQKRSDMSEIQDTAR